MSHDNHTVEENPKVYSTSAFIFVLLIVALIIALFGFIQSMSAEDGHGHETTADAHHGHDDAHSFANPYTYNAAAMAGNEAVQIEDNAAKTVEQAMTEITSDSANAVIEEAKAEETPAH